MCGLAAYIGKDYDPLIFKFIALAQDAKGRDNAGIGFIKDDRSNFITYLGGKNMGVFNVPPENDTHYWATSLAELLGDNVNLRDLPVTGITPIMAHSRKATVGNGDIINAQPYVYKEIMLMHNGTITEPEMYTKKFNLPAYSSDSQVIAHMFAKGYIDDFLITYKGTASLIWSDIHSPETLYIFSGSDQHWGEAPPPPRKELYYLQLDNGIYISSVKQVLEMGKEIAKDPNSTLGEIEQFKSNVVYSITKEGITNLRYINRRIKIETEQNAPPAPSNNNTALNILIKDVNTLVDLEDHAQFVGGKYYIGTTVANTIWKIGPEGNVIYYPIYIHPPSQLAYKKMNDTRYIGVHSNVKFQGDIEELVSVPFLDGALLTSWANFFKLVKNYSVINIGSLAASSYLPINVRIFDKGVKSEYFITSRPGGAITSTINIPFTHKAYRFVNNTVAEILTLKNKIAVSTTKRYIKTLQENDTDANAKEPEKKEGNKLGKFKVIIGVCARLANDKDLPSNYRSAAYEVAKFLNDKLKLKDERVGPHFKL